MRNLMPRLSGAAALVLAAASALVALPAAPASAAATPQTINAYAGTSDPNVDANGFYPGVITIAEGDTVHWEVDGFHTISLGDVAPFDTNHVGDNTFTGGSDAESSGAPVSTYDLVFGAGSGGATYPFFCTIHPGMQGLVQVLAATSATPSQGTLDAAAGSEKASDLTAGENALNSFNTTTQPAAGGGTQINLAAGVAPKQVVDVEIGTPGTVTSNAEGQATLTVTGNNLHVDIAATGLPPSTSHLAHIHTGSCATPYTITGHANNILIPFPNLDSDANGNAAESFDVDLSTVNGFSGNVIPQHGWYINIHGVPNPADPNQVICGDVLPHRASALRFVDNPVSISVGDTVSWTNMDPQEPHTVTIGEGPGNPFAPAFGGNTVNTAPDATNIHSGVFNEGETFKLTFDKPGTYNYFCAIHQQAGMVGTVIVQPLAGYWIGAQDGGVFTFGDASYFGSKGSQQLVAPIVGIAAAPDRRGYWLADNAGHVFNFGSAGNFGSMSTPLTAAVVGIAPAPDGKGYWLAASDGGVFAFGSAKYFGSEGGHAINQPVVGIAGAPDGKGYWLTAADGGIFAFGSAGFHGSEGGHAITKPVVGIAAAPDGNGYWLVASDGGVFAFGTAKYNGSMGGSVLAQPIVAIAPTSSGSGYWMVGSDGGIFNFGDAPFLGSTGGLTLAKPVIGMAAIA